jgi:pyruvate dehydrogenase E2 component (dihydrolipoyllysine-residue acetyltransferase)
VAALKDVPVPDIGDFADVPIIEMLVAVGDRVEVEDPLLVLESDKATMEVPSPFAGVVSELRVGVGDTVSEGTVLVVLDTAQAEGNADADAGADPQAEAVTAKPEADAAGPVHASPAVRRLARERGIDLHDVNGTGRKGRIVKADLDGAGPPAAVPAVPAPAPAPPVAPVAAGDERVDLTRIQQISARTLAAAWPAVPQVTQHEDADITELEAFRQQLNAERSDVKITMVALLLKASAATLRAFPRVASQLDGDELVVKHDLHLGFAADTPQGLVVPVVRDVDRKGIVELATELTDLSGKARAGKLSPKEISGAVFTISSLGGIGGTGFTPLVAPPQVAILGVVRSRMQPVWTGEAFEPRLMLPLSLTYDHRVIDGALAARFCVHLAGVLSDMRRVLL